MAVASTAVNPFSPQLARSDLPRSQRVGKSQLYERLARDTDSSGLSVNRVQEIHGKIYIDTLNVTPWPARLHEVEMGRQVFPCVVHLVQTSRAQRLSRRGSAFLLLDARDGLR